MDYGDSLQRFSSFIFKKGEVIMRIITVYWNAKSFTTYRTTQGGYMITDNYIWIMQEDANGKPYTLYIPWHSINRFTVSVSS